MIYGDAGMVASLISRRDGARARRQQYRRIGADACRATDRYFHRFSFRAAATLLPPIYSQPRLISAPTYGFADARSMQRGVITRCRRSAQAISSP